MSVNRETLSLWRKWYRPVLDDLYKAAHNDNVLLTPDAAVNKMEEVFAFVFKAEQRDENKASTSFPRFDGVAFSRDAHHYAVDLFYKTYHKRTGAPPLRADYLNLLLKLDADGMNPAQIASKLGHKPDAIRKQLTLAKKRVSLAENIQELGTQARATFERKYGPLKLPSRVRKRK